MEEIKNVPEIRFGGFTDNWGITQLNEVTELFEYGLNASAVEYDGVNKYIRITDIDDKTNNFNQNAITSPNTNLEFAENFKLKEGDLLFARTGASVGKSYLYKNSDGLVYFAGFLIRARLNSSNDFNFIFQKTLSNEYRKFVQITSQRSGQPGINAQEYSEFEFSIPKHTEQKRIGALLFNIDSLVVNHNTQLKKLTNLKKAMLIKMFPQDGASVPEIRFKGFDEVWEKCILSDVTEYHNGKGYESEQSTSGKYELINLNSISIDGGLKPSGKFINNAELTLNKDDLVMILSDVGHGDLLGRVAIIPENNKYVLNQRVALLRPELEVLPLFLYYTINVNQIYFKKQGAGMSQLNISKSSVEDFEFLYPTIREEQIKISNYFKNFDNLITNHKEQLKKLNQIKKACLSKLFVSQD